MAAGKRRPMSGLHRHIERIWWQAAEPPRLLRLAEPLYAAISRRHLARRARRATQPPLPLISVGNITVGGSGKTPFVIWLAEALQRAGHAPVILCRGDGGSGARTRRVMPGDDPAQCGDEAVLLAGSDFPVIAGRDRVAGARVAGELGDVIILDDGFQYRQLERACDIVLVPADGVGNGRLIPAGPLREPLSALDRADIIVRSGAGDGRPLTKRKEWRWRAGAGALRDAMQLETTAPAQVLAATGIARPRRFVEDLGRAGVRITSECFFPDHHRFSATDVRRLLEHRMPVAVTAKDAVKLTRLWPRDVPLWVLPQHGRGENGLAEAILAHADIAARGGNHESA